MSAEWEDEEYEIVDAENTEDSDSSQESLTSALVGLGIAAVGVGIGKVLNAAAEGIAESEKRALDEQAAARRARNRFWKKYWKIVVGSIAGIIAFIAWLIFMLYLSWLRPIDISSEELTGLHFEEVERMLHDAGFSDTVCEAVEDLAYKDVDMENEVFQVRISGKTDFKPEDKFAYNAKVKILYHTLREISVPITSKELKEMQYKDAEKIFTEVGFVNIKCEPMNDLITGWLNKDGEIEQVTINGEKRFDTEDCYRPDVEIIIKYHTYK